MTEQHTTYFDLHTQGLGYLHRAREVTPKRGQPFLAVEISALHGAEDAVQYTRFDTRVSGREAQAIVRELMPDIAAEKRVLVGFKLGDLYAEPFEYQKGEKQGPDGCPAQGQAPFRPLGKDRRRVCRAAEVPGDRDAPV
ncbi:MAG: DUF3577 domain-containing protein [Pseudomonadota bacterium]|nr:DUF3577 domain-containing protein [Pseudomonadota bacterium]